MNKILVYIESKLNTHPDRATTISSYSRECAVKVLPDFTHLQLANICNSLKLSKVYTYTPVDVKSLIEFYSLTIVRR